MYALSLFLLIGCLCPVLSFLLVWFVCVSLIGYCISIGSGIFLCVTAVQRSALSVCILYGVFAFRFVC